VRARGGDLLISSEPGRGTKVRVRLLVENPSAVVIEGAGALV